MSDQSETHRPGPLQRWLPILAVLVTLAVQTGTFVWHFASQDAKLTELDQAKATAIAEAAVLRSSVENVRSTLSVRIGQLEQFRAGQESRNSAQDQLLRDMRDDLRTLLSMVQDLGRQQGAQR